MGTTNIELERYAKILKLKNFRGCFMIDEINKIKPMNKECGILNLNRSDKNINGHWVCWFKNGDEKYYFDSYGVIAPQELIKYLGRDIIQSTYQIQQFNDDSCGEWCLYVLNELNNGQNFEDIILNIIDKNNLY